MSPPQLWNGALRRLAPEVGSFAMQAWIEPLHAETDGDVLRILCPSVFHRDRVRQRLLERIETCVHAQAERPVRVVLEVGAPSRAQPVVVQSAVEGTPETPRETRIDAADTPSRAVRARSAPAAQRSFSYSFDSFIVGPGNALAREACVAVAGGRQAGLGSLYVAAASGLGKTHLARSVFAEAAGAERPLYTSAEAFTGEFQSAIRGGHMDAFKRRYRGCDLLVVEDVQFLPGKKATQLELFHTIDHLRDAGARLVFTGDRLPSRIPDLDPRLRSRWNGGLVAEIEPPDALVRREILRSKAAAGGVRIPADCLDLMVDRLRGSVRDLEGALIQVVATATLLKRSIDIELTESALRKVTPETAAERRRDPEAIIQVVATFFQTTPAALASRSRRRDVLVPRQLAMYLCRRYTDASLTRIGRAFDRDHPAVKNAIDRVERQILERAPLRYQFEALASRLEHTAR
jgi:chromosomal replication initiator protein